MKVTIVNSHSYKGKYEGCTGTIVDSTYKDSIAVRLDGLSNPASSKGRFYFKPKELTGGYMESNYRAGGYMEGNYRTVCIRFVSDYSIEATQNSEYLYACFDETIGIGNYVVVKSAHHGYGVARIVALSDHKVPEERIVVAKFDPHTYMEACEKRRLAASLKKKMEDRAAALQDITLFTSLAAYDKEMAELLDSYKRCTGVE